ncbi:hypothetical protein FRC12_013377 [Ceratobasidium sp. 428]|nr:hypothetical protein FRC12_013377 [Ceratobasidium sp. 428]
MLPPPVPASATASPAGTPKPTKVYEPLIGEIDMALFDSSSRSPERALPTLPLRPMLTPNTHTPSPNDDYTIPAHLFVNKPPISWEVTYMGPERTPSPPIGESRVTWAPKTKAEDRRRFLVPEPSVPEPKVKIEAQPGTALGGSSGEVFGPASRTRARVSNGGVGAGKGKARA